jgi:hypothetical protein
LLQRVDAEGVGDLILLQRSVRTIGADKERAILAEEGRGDAEMGQARIVEVAEHGRLGHLLHRLVMIRPLP